MDKFISLGLLLNRTSTAISSALNAALTDAGIDLPHSQFIVLRCLYYNGEQSQSDIARLLSKDAAAIKRTIDNLEQKGFVKRVPVRTLKNTVHITDDGKNIMPEVIKIAESVTERAFGELTPDRREELMSALMKITNNLTNKNI